MAIVRYGQGGVILRPVDAAGSAGVVNSPSGRRLTGWAGTRIPHVRSRVMKIVIPGGSGQVGTLLARAFAADGDDVVILSRRPTPAPWRVVPWDGTTIGDWAGEFDGADAVINLAGRTVNCRYTAANRREILASRIT